MITQDYLQAVKALKDAIMQSRYRTIQHVDMFWKVILKQI